MSFTETITKLRTMRGWSEYKLSVESGIPQSTISSWYRKGACPSVASLEAICKAFGISIAQFYGEDNALTAEQKQLLEAYSCMTDEQRKALLQLLATFHNKAE